MTAKEWREKNIELAKKGNIRDYADLIHLIILNNLQNTNAELIENNVSQSERLIRLNNSARRQMKSLQNNNLNRCSLSSRCVMFSLHLYLVSAL
jgi:hypothetical protein